MSGGSVGRTVRLATFSLFPHDGISRPYSSVLLLILKVY